MRCRNPTFSDDLLRLADASDWRTIRGCELPDNTDDPEERDLIQSLNNLSQLIEREN